MSLSLEGLVKKVYRAFIVSVGKIQGFSFVALYCPVLWAVTPSTHASVFQYSSTLKVLDQTQYSSISQKVLEYCAETTSLRHVRRAKNENGFEQVLLVRNHKRAFIGSATCHPSQQREPAPWRLHRGRWIRDSGRSGGC